MENRIIARVVLIPDGSVHILYMDGQTFFCTAATMLCLLADPYHFLEKGRSILSVSTYLINAQKKPIDDIGGLTLLTVYSDKRIICDFTELFQVVLQSSIAESPAYNNVLRIETETLFDGDFDTKKALLWLFFAQTQSTRENSSQFMRNIEVPEEILLKITDEIFNISKQNHAQQEITSIGSGTKVTEISNLVASISNSDHSSDCPEIAAEPPPPDTSNQAPSKSSRKIVPLKEYAIKHGVNKRTVDSWAYKGKLATAFKGEDNRWYVDINDSVTDGRAGRKVKPKADGSGRKVTRAMGRDPKSVQLYIKERKLVTDNIRPFIRTLEEAWYYEQNSYHEVSWECGNAMIIDVNPDYKCPQTGMTNRERMLDGDPPIVPGKHPFVFQLHHIGQKTDSPFAIIPQDEHNKKGANSFFHLGKACKEDLHGKEFDEQKKTFWKTYIKKYDEYGSYRKIPFINSKHKKGERA